MTGMSRKLGFVFALTALYSAPVWAQDVEETFQQGVELLQRGRDEEALRAFQKVLAADPSHEQAYELWKSTDHKIWLEILTKEGDFELVAKRLMGLVNMARTARRDDPDAIRALVAQLSSEDPISRRAAIRQLSAEHGEYAVPLMLIGLADQGSEQRRVDTMQALTEMNVDVVVPLIEALDSPDAFLRRNVSYTLGRIGDGRAAGALGRAAAHDPDASVQQAAREAMGSMQSSGNPVRDLLKKGQDYHMRRDNVLADYMYSDVVWHWGERGLGSRPVPRSLYADEMAKKAFYRALELDPASVDARAGLARAYSSQISILHAMSAAGVDMGDLADQVNAGMVSVSLTGADAIDAALTRSLQQGDTGTAMALAHADGAIAARPSNGLTGALSSKDAAVRSQAAIALGEMALAGKGKASAETVTALGEAAGRAIVRIAFVIDADTARANALAAGLRGEGMLVDVANTGAKGLAMIGRVPGVDVVLVADRLPDLTTFQVINDLASRATTAETPVLVISGDVDGATELFGDKTAGILGGAEDLSAVSEATAGQLDGDRAQADMLSERAANILAGLASAGNDIGAALGPLAGTLASRPDAVVGAAARALGISGTSAQASALLSVVADDGRSEAARAACGHGLAGIYVRNPGGGGDAVATLSQVVLSSAPLGVRKAAAHALSSLKLTAAQRAELLAGVRVDLGAGEGPDAD